MPRRKTKAQSAILALLQNEEDALSHEGIMERVGQRMDRVTIYRILNRFVEDGLAHRIIADDGRQYFARCEQGCSHDGKAHDHLHFRCVVCDRVECITGNVGYQLPQGYQVDNYNVILSGSCRECSGAE